jgi:DNA-binding transcriptional regulator LsrR (DeoR family)
MNKKSGPKNLNIKTIQDIRFLYEYGQLTQQQIATKFNLSQSTVCKIINNNIHKNTSTIKISGDASVKLKSGYKYGN